MKKQEKNHSEKSTTKVKTGHYNIKVIILSGITVVSILLNVYLVTKPAAGAKKETITSSVEDACSLDIIRNMHGEKHYIYPLILAELNSESQRFDNLKLDLSKLIMQRESGGAIESVSVYLKDIRRAEWMSIGSDKEYLPGSLMKVPIMIYFLKEEQEHPGTLKKEILYERPQSSFPEQSYRGDSIVPGKKYSISELLRYMIDESDNNATWALTRQIDQQKYKQIFADLNIPPYEVSNTRYALSPRQYSKFLRVLYNASYLNVDLSAYALQLLSGCKFRDGIAKDLPTDITIAHKFGERGINYDMDFSESAIIYNGSKPYLLTIMTRGKDIKLQTALVSEISAEIFMRYKDL